MSKSKVDSKHKSGKLNKLHKEKRQQQGPRNLGQPTPKDFAKQLSQQLNALEQTFNEAREAKHPLQSRNGSIEKLKEISPRRDSVSDDADKNAGDNDKRNRNHDSEMLERRCTQGKRMSSNASNENQSNPNAQDQTFSYIAIEHKLDVLHSKGCQLLCALSGLVNDILDIARTDHRRDATRSGAGISRIHCFELFS
jgi:hypothetical protein